MRTFARRHTESLTLGAAFAFPAFTMLAVLAADGVAPFGPNTVFNSDCANIYSLYLAHLHDMVLGGEGVFWSWNIGMGYSIYPYLFTNLSSPLNLIILLFPEEALSEALLLVQLLRIGLMGLACAWYLRKHEMKPAAAILLGGAYALSAWTVCYFQFVMWLDVVIILPFMVYAAEHMARTRSILSLPLLGLMVLAFWCDYYHGYMMALFIALYLVWYTVGELRQGPKEVLVNLLKLLLIGAFTFLILGVELIGVIIANVSSGEFVNLSLEPYFGFVDITYPLYFGSYDVYFPMGRPQLYCGLFVVLLGGLYFANRLITRRERVCSGTMLAALFAGLVLAPLYYAWHLFDQPDWFEGRQTFLIIFFLVVLASREMEKLRGSTRRHVAICTVAALAVLVVDTLVCNALPAENVHEFALGPLVIEYSRHKMVWPLVVANVALIAAYCALFWHVAGQCRPADAPPSQRPKLIRARTALMVACFAELAISAFVLNGIVCRAEPYAAVDDFETKQAAVSATVNGLGAGTESPYRVEKLFSYRENDAVACGYKGISVFGTEFDVGTHRTLKSLGVLASMKIARYSGTTPVTDSLLGIRYILADPDEVFDRNSVELDSSYQRALYRFLGRQNGLSVYENEQALPLAYLVNADLANLDLNALPNVFERQNELVKTAFGTDENCFVALDAPQESAFGLEVLHNADGTITLTRTNQSAGSGDAADGSDNDASDSAANPASDAANPASDAAPTATAYVDFTVNAPSSSRVFAYCAENAPTGGVLFENADEYDVPESNAFALKRDYPRIVELVEEDDRYVFRIELDQDFEDESITLPEPVFYRLDERAFTRSFAQAQAQTQSQAQLQDRAQTRTQAQAQSSAITELSSNHVTVQVDARQDQMLFLTTSGNDGWSATVNGQPAEIEHVLEGFAGIRVPEGESTVELTYTLPGWDLGVKLTIAGLILLALWQTVAVLLGRRQGRRRAKPAGYESES